MVTHFLSLDLSLENVKPSLFPDNLDKRRKITTHATQPFYDQTFFRSISSTGTQTKSLGIAKTNELKRDEHSQVITISDIYT